MIAGRVSWPVPSFAEADAGAWLGVEWSELWLVPLSALGIFVAIVVIVRLTGLRSFSKMSSFDFAVTVSVGSIMASVATTSASLLSGVLAVVALLGVQAVVALARFNRNVHHLTDNTPMLLMEDGQLLRDNLRTARVTPTDVVAKLREANVLRIDEVRAVVLETTGDISVLHGQSELDQQILANVRRSASDAAVPVDLPTRSKV